MLKVLRVLAGVLLVLGAVAVWVVWPVRDISGGSWCDRIHTYESQQRVEHGGKLPLLAGMRVDLSLCGVDTSHPAYKQ